MNTFQDLVVKMRKYQLILVEKHVFIQARDT